MADLLIAGTGLIGTSLGLALRSRDVVLQDPDVARLERAVQRGAGRVWDGSEPVTTAVVCAPPDQTARVVITLMRTGLASTFTHVCGVQAPVQAEVELAGVDMASFCGGHPMAGRERSGPDAAAGELFAGRSWVVCAGRHTSAPARAAVLDLAVAVGAHPVELSAEEHDRAVALVSHLPQVAASALAGRLLGGADLVGTLAGPGLQDSTRIAASDPELWRGILRLNAAHLAPLVQELADDLARTGRALAQLAAGHGTDLNDVEDVVAELLRRGVAGRESVPVKRGERGSAFVTVAVSVPDAPGQLAGLLATAAHGGVNVEDVRVDHVPDSAVGVIEILVRPQARAEAVAVLRTAGWDVLGGDGRT